MAPEPLILALANPEPEIRPELAAQVRPDAILCTGRSDYPNQVNNVLCFPFIFRGALDVGATTINEAMKVAAVHAIAELARAEASDVVASAYGGTAVGVRSRLPHPQAVRSAPDRARRAGGRSAPPWTAGVATRPLTDLDGYRERLGALRLPVRHQHEAGVPGGQGCAQAGRSMRREKSKACCGPCRSSWTKGWRSLS